MSGYHTAVIDPRVDMGVRNRIQRRNVFAVEVTTHTKAIVRPKIRSVAELDTSKRYVTQSRIYDEEYATIPCVSGVRQKNGTRRATIIMSGIDVCCLVDSGAEVNLIGEDIFRKLKFKKLSRPAKKLCSYGPEGERRELPLLSCFRKRE